MMNGQPLIDLLASFFWEPDEHEWHGFFDHSCGQCLLAGCDCGECNAIDYCGERCLIPRNWDGDALFGPEYDPEYREYVAAKMAGVLDD